MDYSDLTHIAGPAILTYNGVTYYTEGDISVAINQETWDVPTSRFGIISRRIKSLPVATISFKPDGQVTSGRMAGLFPYTAASVGKSIFTASDVPLVIQTLGGAKYTFPRAGISGLCGLNLSAASTATDGTMSFMAINAKAADPTTANNFLKVEATAFSDVSFDQTKVLSPGYTAAYGLVFTTIEAVDGFKISMPISVSPINIDRYGTVDVFLTSVGPASCSFAPAGMAEADWLTLVALDGASVRMPGSQGSTDLVITGTGLVVTLPSAVMHMHNLAYGASANRHGVLTFSNRHLFTNGVPAALLTITVS